MIRVLLVDDHEMVRLGLSAYLDTQPDIEIVGKPPTGKKRFGWRRNLSRM